MLGVSKNPTHFGWGFCIGGHATMSGMSPRIYIVWGVAALVLAGAMYLIIRDFSDFSPMPSVTDTGTTTPNGTETGESPNVKPNHPSLDRPITFPAGTSAESRLLLGNKLKELIQVLNNSPSHYDSWIDLGIYRKEIEDYEGARQAWEYATKLNPTNSVAHGNLGNLYGYYLKDSTRAETSLRSAIQQSPSEPYYYVQTYLFYIDVVKDSAKALAVIEEGLRALPGDSQLSAILAELPFF